MAQQQANMGSVDNATVTLYYFDNASGTKGGIVPMPDNPQKVNWDPKLAAPGMYTFSRVPAGQYYYLEADHNGNKWYATFYMEENVGTVTRNVAIPPWTALNVTTTATPNPTSAPIQTAPPLPSSSPTPAPSRGFQFVAAASAAIFAMAITSLKRR
jgi:hypothetical protein